MLINAANMVTLLQTFRVVHFAGRPGGGKTALAYRLAYELLVSHGYRYVLSNCNDVWSDAPADIRPRVNPITGEPQFLDAVVILDEAGVVFESGAHAREFLAAIRKLNIVILLPSYEDPPPRVRHLQIERKFYLNPVGVPLWWYTCKLSTKNTRERLEFGWWRPSEIFGVYDTSDFMYDDGGIGEFLRSFVAAKAEKSRKRRGVNSGRRAQGEISYGMAAGGGDFEALQDAAEEIRDAVSVLQSNGKKRRSRWR